MGCKRKNITKDRRDDNLKKNRGSFINIIVSIVLLLIVVILIALFSSDEFEQEPPKIDTPNRIYWNLKSPLYFNIEDKSGLKKISANLITQKAKTELLVNFKELNKSTTQIQISPIKSTIITSKDEKYTLQIVAIDKSKWNFFNGNESIINIEVIKDTQIPIIQTIANSYSITKGGSALIIFKVVDESLKELYIEDDKNRFYPQPFYKDGYYASLIAWPVTKEGGFNPKIIAIDEAGNTNVMPIKLFLKNRNYKVSKIGLKDDFLNGKIVEVLAEANIRLDFNSSIDRFRYVNEDMRIASEELIYKEAKRVDKNKMIDSFNLEPFYPLKNGAAVASFGDRRFFEYQGKQVSDSWHLGLDLASIQNAEIRSSNSGEVVLADYNGIYGNMILIDHGFGLISLYGHCSHFFVRKGDSVSKDQVIANSGKTGLALGDHLHFGLLVQGIEVRPEEWMDRQWMKLNITDVFESAKKIIDGAK